MQIRATLTVLQLRGGLLAQQAPPLPLPDPQLVLTAQRYAAATWPQGALRAGIDLDRLELPGLRGGDVEHAPPAPLMRRFADAAGVPRVLVEAVVADDVAAADARLVSWLGTVSSPAPVPTASSEGIVVGELGFVGHSAPPRISWIAFVRGNVAVRVSCLDPRVDPHPNMPGIAAAVDAAIVATRALGKGEVVPKPVVRTFTAERATCRVGENVVLAVDVRDPQPDRAPALEFVVGGPGQGYVEPDATGRYVLHTTKAGAIALVLQATGSLGSLSQATVKIDVAAN